MSERGTFVTEFVHCNDCFEKVKKVLLSVDFRKEILYAYTLGKNAVAGQIRGSWSGEELWIFESNIIPKLNKLDLCHRLRISVISDSCGEKTFTFGENKTKQDNGIAISSFDMIGDMWGENIFDYDKEMGHFCVECGKENCKNPNHHLAVRRMKND